MNLELGEANSEIETYVTKEEELKKELASLDDEDAKVQETIKSSQDTITMKLKEREDTLVLITQLKTELDMLKDKEVSVVNALSMMARSLVIAPARSAANRLKFTEPASSWPSSTTRRFQAGLWPAALRASTALTSATIGALSSDAERP